MDSGDGELVGDSEEGGSGDKQDARKARLKRLHTLRHRVAGIATKSVWRTWLPLALAVAEFEAGYLVGERFRVALRLESYLVELCAILSRLPPPEPPGRVSRSSEVGRGVSGEIPVERSLRICVTAVQVEGVHNPVVLVGYEFILEAKD